MLDFSYFKLIKIIFLLFRIECDNLRKELQKQKEEEKSSELEQLTNLKEEEIRNLKTIWQAKTNELLEEVN